MNYIMDTGTYKIRRKAIETKKKVSNSWVQSCEDNVGDVLKRISRVGGVILPLLTRLLGTTATDGSQYKCKNAQFV